MLEEPGLDLVGDMTALKASDLALLRGARALRGRLTLRLADGGPEALVALHRLEEVGALTVEACPELESLAGLERLRLVHGDLTVVASPRLTSLDALASLERVEGTLRLGAPDEREDAATAPPVDALGSLARAALPNLRTVGGIVVEGNDALAHLSLPALEGVEQTGVRVRFNPRLETLSDAFPRLVKVVGPFVVGGGQRILRRRERDERGVTRLVEYGRAPRHGNDVLRNVELPALVYGEALEIGDNPALRTVDAPAVTKLVALSLSGSAQLRSASFERLESLGGAGWEGGLALTSTPAVQLFTPRLATVHGRLALSDTAFADLTMLASLVQVNGFVVLFGNSRLTSLRGLEGLRSVEQLQLQYNDALKSLAGLDGLEVVLGGVSLEGNGLETAELPRLRSVDKVEVLQELNLRRLALPALERAPGGVFVRECEALEELAFPRLATTGALHLAAGSAPLPEVAFPLLREATGALEVAETLGSFAPLGSLERVGGDLRVRSSLLADSAIQAFVAQLRARRGIGGVVDATGVP